MDGEYSNIVGNILYGDGTGSGIVLEGTDHVVMSANTIYNFTYIFGCYNGSPTTYTDIMITGNSWQSAVSRPLANLGNTVFGARISVFGNSSTLDIIDYENDVVDGYITGTPEGTVVAGVGSTIRRVDGGAGTSLYIKEAGTGNTGWVAK